MNKTDKESSNDRSGADWPLVLLESFVAALFISLAQLFDFNWENKHQGDEK